MAKIRLTREFRFETAHALWNHDGPCKNIHGHSYKLQVTVIGEPLSEDGNPKDGMVMDFGELKAVVEREIVKEFDHAIVFSHKVPEDLIRNMSALAGHCIIKPYQPTCENMLLDFAERLRRVLPGKVELFSLRLHETGNSYAEWHASDN